MEKPSDTPHESWMETRGYPPPLETYPQAGTLFANPLNVLSRHRNSSQLPSASLLDDTSSTGPPSLHFSTSSNPAPPFPDISMSDIIGFDYLPDETSHLLDDSNATAPSQAYSSASGNGTLSTGLSTPAASVSKSASPLSRLALSDHTAERDSSSNLPQETRHRHYKFVCETWEYLENNRIEGQSVVKDRCGAGFGYGRNSI